MPPMLPEYSAILNEYRHTDSATASSARANDDEIDTKTNAHLLMSSTRVISSTRSSNIFRTSRSLQYDQYHVQHYDPTYVAVSYETELSTSSWEFNTLTNRNGSTYFGYGGGGGSETEGTENLSPSNSTQGGSTLIIVCTLFVPLVIAISAILIIAFLIKRMRRAESIRDMADDEDKSAGETLTTSQFYHYSQEISIENIPQLHSAGGYKSSSRRPPASQPIFIPPPVKKLIPLPVILGLVEPDDKESTTIDDSSIVVIQQDELDNNHFSTSSNQNNGVVSRGLEAGSSPSPPKTNNNNSNSSTSLNFTHKLKSSSSTNSLNHNLGGSSGSTPPLNSPSKSSFSDRILNVLNFPKRRKEQAAERKRFNIYTVSLETREQLKQIYVY